MLKPSVELVAYTPNPERLVAAAARLCYSSRSASELMVDLSDEKVNNFIDKLATIGHESPMEHISFTFAIEGVSRAFLAQITRHRIASYTVQSQRYVDKKNFPYIVPPNIADDDKLFDLYKNTMDLINTAYKDLSDSLTAKYTEELLKDGLDEKSALKIAEKKAIEDSRFVLPNACDTKMVVTMNTRSLLNFFHLRCCNRAQWEIKEVANLMLKLVFNVAPNLFANAGPGCVSGSCTEGKMTCGKIKEVREFYQNLKGDPQ